MIQVSRDAFSDGQVSSKLWLCDELEKVVLAEPSLARRELVIWVMAGWCGVLPFLLFSRGRLPIARIHLFDLDPAAAEASLAINDAWRFTGRFQAHLGDVNSDLSEFERPDIVINTSCEHFEERGWWQQIPSGALVALQSTDMENSQHVSLTQSPEELQSLFRSWSSVAYTGRKEFAYSTFRFARHMVIGFKSEENHSSNVGAK